MSVLAKTLPKLAACLLIAAAFFESKTARAQTDSIVLRDIDWDKSSPAGMTELAIPSDSSLLAGFMYNANGAGKHPTLLLLHGYPGNERNLDLAQVARAHGWNVLYFDYRGSWGSQGKFSFKHCVEDVINVVAYCKKNAETLKIDTSNMVLFGHSMGGWVCLKALEQLPEIKKGFALSTWDIYGSFRYVTTEKQLMMIVEKPSMGLRYFVLNSSLHEIFTPVLKDRDYFNIEIGASTLSQKQIIMIDEHTKNGNLANALKSGNQAWFDYEVWQTDHPFTNKRVALIKKVIAFLDK